VLTHYGHWVQPPHTPAKGPAPKPRWMPVPDLLYARVIKTYRRRHLVHLRSQVVFGTLATVTQVLAAQGWQIDTAFIERLNLSSRQHVAALGRRVTTLCKGEVGLHQQWPSITSTTISVCPMAVYGSPYPSLHQRKGRARRNAGAPVHRRWPRG
jgi:hypothetical protein